jgi:hypothetical protein
MLANNVQEPMNLEALARNLILPALVLAQMELHSWRAFRRVPDSRMERTAATEHF